MSSIEDLARRRMALLEQREAVESEIKNIDAQLIDAVEVGGHIDLDGEPVLRVAQKRDFRVTWPRRCCRPLWSPPARSPWSRSTRRS